MEKVSVIIPVYNGEKYISQSINSVINQTYNKIEIIIINDGSTDKTEEIIFENFYELIKNGRIIYKKQQNCGRNIAGNEGAKLANGKYIFFLDADDLWKKNHIEEMLKIFNKTEADAIYTKPRIFIDENNNIKRISNSKIEKDIDKLIFSSRIGFPSATGFRKKSFIGYNPDFHFREDIELFIRLRLENKNIVIADTNSVMIREHNSPNRMSKDSKFYKYTLKLYETYKNKIPYGYRANFYLHIAEIALKFGDFYTGNKILLQAIKDKPSILFDARNMLNIIKRLARLDKFLKS